MSTLWYVVLGLSFAGYLVLAGLDYGVGLLLWPTGRDAEERRAALNALGPLFLGNEVWIVAVVGVLIGAFPLLESELFQAYRPLVVVLVLGLVTVAASVQLRSRLRGSTLDGVIGLASAVLAFGWGNLLGCLMSGVDLRHGGPGWYPPLVGIAMMALIALHGAAFLAWRQPGRLVGIRAGSFLRPIAWIAGLCTASAVGAGALSPDVRASVTKPAVAFGLAAGVLLAIVAAAWTRHRGLPRLALGSTALALALPVLLVGASRYPYAFGQMTVAGGAAGEATLRLLSWYLIPLAPVLAIFQAMCWWVLRSGQDRPVLFYW